MSSQKNKGMPLNTFTRTCYSLPDSVWWGQTQLHAMHSWAARRAHRLVVCQKKILTPVQCTWPEGVPTRKKSSSRKDSIDGRPSTADSSGLSETSTPPTRDSTPAKARVSSDYNQPPMSRRHRHVHISLYVLFTNKKTCVSVTYLFQYLKWNTRKTLISGSGQSPMLRDVSCESGISF